MAKCLISHLLCAVLCLLCCAGISIAAVVQHVPQKGERTWQAYTAADNIADEKSGGNWRPIRIALFENAVDEVLQRCKRKWVIAERLGKPFSATGDDEVLCDKVNGISNRRRDLLLEKLLPDAIKLHRDRLSIQRREGDAVVSARTIKSISKRCKITVANEQLEGFPDADFVFFVKIAASRTRTRICSQEENKRPTAALITFIPKDIVDTRHFVRTAAHEMAHGLGFQGPLLQELRLIHSGVASDRGDVPAVKSKIMGKKVTAHYSCVRDHVTEMYMEVEGASKDISHWERRIAKDELMSPYTGEPSGMYYTALTLAAFHSMEFYSANFSMAEPMSWGNQSGCDLLKDTCTKSSELPRKYTGIFCSEREPVLQCTTDRFSLGMCSANSELGDRPQVYHHFENLASDGRKGELTNDCPIIKPFMETSCETGKETLMPGSIVSKISRCLDVKDPLSTNVSGGIVKVKGICANVKCENGKVKVQYKRNKSGDASGWHECSREGLHIPLENSVLSGNIVCPKYEEVCTGLPETAPYTMKYEEVVVPKKDVKEAGEQTTSTGGSGHVTQTSDDGRAAAAVGKANTERAEETVQRGSASSEPTVTTDPVDVAGVSTAAKNTAPSTATDDGAESHQSSTTTDGESHTINGHDTAPAATSPSTSNPSSTDHTVHSHNTVTGAHDLSSHTVTSSSLQGRDGTKTQLEEVLNHANANELVGTDSSTVASYMTRLVLLVCALAVIMDP